MTNNSTTIEYDYSQTAVQQQTETFLAILQSEIADTSETLYLLVDPVPLLKQGTTPFIDTLVARQPVPVTLPHSSLSVADYPWLLPLDLSKAEDQSLLQQSVSFALHEIAPEKLCQKAGRAICGWLSSPFDSQIVAKQLGNTAIQKDINHAPMLMRYYDPAAHNLLWPMLKPFQQQRLMGVLSRWILVDGDGQPVIHRHTADASPHFTFLLGLTDEQTSFILHDIGIINRALRQHRKLAAMLPRRPEAVNATLIQQAMTRIAGHPAFDSEAEQEAFALQILRYHPHIDRHPKIDYLLHPDTFADDVPWSQRTKNMTSAQWQQYAHDCDIQEHQHTTTEKAS